MGSVGNLSLAAKRRKSRRKDKLKASLCSEWALELRAKSERKYAAGLEALINVLNQWPIRVDTSTVDL